MVSFRLSQNFKDFCSSAPPNETCVLIAGEEERYLLDRSVRRRWTKFVRLCACVRTSLRNAVSPTSIHMVADSEAGELD